MQYKDEMRRLIDIVKQQSFNAPLVQTLDDLKTMTNAVKDLSDRVEVRVRKSLTADTKTADKKTSKKKSKKSKAIKPFPSIKPNNTQTTKQQTQQTTTPSTPTNSLPTNNNVSASSFSAKDISNMRNDFVQKQQALQPIKPLPSF
tara:strand:+ start:167 stop:601 length:435 start_codon:yes stop_codon:yes gene_type:complete